MILLWQKSCLCCTCAMFCVYIDCTLLWCVFDDLIKKYFLFQNYSRVCIQLVRQNLFRKHWDSVIVCCCGKWFQCVQSLVWKLFSPYVKRGFRAELSAPFHVVRVSQSFSLTIVWYCVAWWNAQWSESDSSIQIMHCKLPHFIAADISHHRCPCTITYDKVFVQHPQVFHSVRMLWKQNIICDMWID